METKGVEAVERALQILDCFDQRTPELGLADLSRRTGLYKSTILRLAASLEKFGHLVRGGDGRFRLGPSTWRLGACYRQGFDLSAVVQPELKRLSDATAETASFYIRDGASRICLLRSEPARAIRHAIAEGAAMPLDQGASGRVLLAFSGLDGEGSDAVRAAGHAVSLGERDPEVAAVAVPLQSGAGRLVGALALSGLITRFGPERRAEMIAALADSRARLAGRIAG